MNLKRSRAIFARKNLGCAQRVVNDASGVRYFTIAIRFLLGAGIILLIATVSNAYAYIDPGYGSLLLQLGIAGFFGTLFYTRNILLKIKTWFKGLKKGLSKAD